MKELDRTKGFTLVELAIVIVIIGLLVGGVLQGQELIEQAKIRRTIAELDSFDVSITTFKAKYNALPGDMRNATQIWGEISANCTNQVGTGTLTCNGDGDGVIDYENSTDSVHEGFRVWQHLSNANLVKGQYTGTNLGLTPIGLKYHANINTPSNQFNSGWAVWYSSWQWVNATGIHFYSFVYPQGRRINPAFGSPTSNIWYKYSLTPEQLMSIDLKIDDGKPWLGKVTNMGVNYTENCATTPSTDKTGIYNLSSSELECIPIIHSKAF